MEPGRGLGCGEHPRLRRVPAHLKSLVAHACPVPPGQVVQVSLKQLRCHARGGQGPPPGRNSAAREAGASREEEQS